MSSIIRPCASQSTCLGPCVMAFANASAHKAALFGLAPKQVCIKSWACLMMPGRCGPSCSEARASIFARESSFSERAVMLGISFWAVYEMLVELTRIGELRQSPKNSDISSRCFNPVCGETAPARIFSARASTAFSRLSASKCTLSWTGSRFGSYIVLNSSAISRFACVTITFGISRLCSSMAPALYFLFV